MMIDISNIPVQNFDVLGFPLFIILFVVGWKIRKREKFAGWFCLFLSILGILADGYSLLIHFIL